MSLSFRWPGLEAFFQLIQMGASTIPLDMTLQIPSPQLCIHFSGTS